MRRKCDRWIFGRGYFHPQKLCHEDSEYALSFEIEQRESGFYSERIESQTDRITQPSSTVLEYRLYTNYASIVLDQNNNIRFTYV